MSIASYARAYAQALDDLEAIRSWQKERPNTWGWPAETDGTQGETVSVTWHFGSGCPGYKELQRSISRRVSSLMPSLMAGALREAEAAVKKAYRELNDAAALGERGYMRAGDTTKVDDFVLPIRYAAMEPAKKEGT